jgi:hypothetical protein
MAWSGSRGAGNPRLPPAWSVLAVLDHRQFFRAFVLSIGEAGNKATTAPGSSGAWWRSPASGPGRRRDSASAADRACRGLLRLSGCSQASVAGVRQGCLRRGPCWRCSIIGSSAGLSSSRSVKPATKRRRRQGRAVPGGDRRQVGQGEGETAYRLPIGRAVACGCGVGVRAIRGCLRRGPCWRCSITGSSSGRSFSRSVKPPTRRRRRQRRAVPGGDRRQVGQCERGTAHRLPIGGAVACGRGVGVWANRGCRWRGPCWQRSTIGSSVGLSSSRSVKPHTKRRRRQGRAVPGGDRRQVGQGEGEKRTGCRSGLPWPVVVVSGCGQTAVASGVARAGGARSSAVRPGLRPLDR